MAADIFFFGNKIVYIFLAIVILAFTPSDCPVYFEHGSSLTKRLKSYNFIRSLTKKRKLPPYCSLKNASENEAECAIEAVKRARSFFRQNGYEIITRISIEFVDEVKAGIVETEQGYSKKEIIPALYNAGTKCIKIVGVDSDYFEKRAVMGAFGFNKEFYISIITHEIAHRLYDSFVGSQVKTIYHPYSEFIAYITQIGTLSGDFRNKVLSLCTEEQFPSIYAINSFMWTADPNKFGLMSYRFYESQPGIFKEFMENKVKPMELCFILEY